MPLDFPNSPTNGQIFTAGGVSWQFNGTAWVSVSGMLSLPDAPGDGATYGRRNAAWNSVDAMLAPVAANANAALNNTGRNAIHNGQFNVQQRGTGPFTGAAAYTADRWQNNLGGADTISTVVSGPYHASAPVGDESLVYYLSVNFTGSATGWTIICQKIENIARLSGKTLTLSFYANCASGTFRIGAGYQQQFGSGGSPSAATMGNIGVTPTLTTSTGWQRYSFTFAMPSSVGKTFGSNVGTDFTEIDFWLSCGSATYTGPSGGIGQQSGGVSFWGVQLEIGSVATPLAKRDPADDLELCQRFYQAYLQVMVNGYAGAGSVFYEDFIYAVPMRAVPTVSLPNATASNAGTLGLNTAYANHLKVQATMTATGGGWAMADVILSADL